MNYLEHYSNFILTYSQVKGHFTPMVLSKVDSSYAGGEFRELNYLFDMGITEFIQNSNNIPFEPINIGFNPTEQAWYAWGKRRFKSFKVGSVVKPGDIAYNPSNQHDFLGEVLKEFISYNNDEEVKVTYRKLTDAIEVTVGWIEKGFTKNFKYPRKWGHGTWVAKDLHDAKQMAIDYANNVNNISLPEIESNTGKNYRGRPVKNKKVYS